MERALQILSGSPPATMPSDALDGLYPAGRHGLREGEIVLLVLLGIGLGEVGDRQIEFIAGAQVFGHCEHVAGAGVRPGQASSRRGRRRN